MFGWNSHRKFIHLILCLAKHARFICPGFTHSPENLIFATQFLNSG